MNPLLDVIRKYFTSPIWDRTGYNWVNTLAYGVLLGLAALISYRFVKRTGYRFDLNLFLMFLPYMVLATTVRALVDAGKYPYTYLLVSPGIYFTAMGIFSAAILAGILVKRLAGVDVSKTVISVGVILAGWQLAFLLDLAKRPLAGLLIIALSSGVCAGLYVARREWPERLWLVKGRENYMVLAFHLIDATVTFIGVDLYGYAEQHVLPRMLIDLFGTGAAMYVLKLAALPIVLYLLDKYVDEEEMNIFIKMIIMALGLAPAVRNSLRILVGS